MDPGESLGQVKSQLRTHPRDVPLDPDLPACQAHHDPGVVHKLRDGHSLSGLCFQQVADKHLHCGVGRGQRQLRGHSPFCSSLFRGNQAQKGLSWRQTAQQQWPKDHYAIPLYRPYAAQ